MTFSEPMLQKGKRITLGLLINRLADSYHAPVWHGIADYVRENDINLLCFADRRPIGNEPYSHYAPIEQLALENRLDGLLLVSGTIGPFFKARESASSRSFLELPLVSISIRHDNVASVVVDNRQGMRDLLNHLIDVHGMRRFAFIEGLKNHQESEVRYQTFVEVLTEKGLEVNPERVVSGNYRHSSGRNAVKVLLDQRQQSFDVLVSANDEMALGALEALQERGFRIPADLAVVGFDDRDEARISNPSLTTVRQPLHQLGWVAAETLVAKINGENVSDPIIMPTKLIIRRSCGCTLQSWVDGFRPTPVDTGADNTGINPKSPSRQTVDAETIDLQFPDSKTLEELAQLFRREMDGEKGRFIRDFERLIRQKNTNDARLEEWQELNTVLHRVLLPEFDHDIETLKRFNSLWQQAGLILGETLQEQDTFRRLLIKRHAMTISEISHQLAAADNVGHVGRAVIQELPRFKIGCFYLGLFDPNENPPKFFHLAAAYRDGVEVPPGDGVYPAHALIPPEIYPENARFSWIIQPLYFREEQFGFIILEMGPREGMVYEVLSGELSSILKSILLFQEQERSKEELARSNAELKNFAYVASHDLQEPLRMITSYLQLLERRYHDKLDESAREFIGFAVDGANRMRTLINDLLEFSRVGTRGKPFSATDCNKVINLALTNLQITIKETRAVITYHALPTVKADSIQLVQLFQNLIGNALKFHGVEPPRIHVSAARQDNEWVFSVSDNGIGIDPQFFERIFLVFQRLHGIGEYPGTGIGLAICKKIVERHSGKIWVESEPGRGTIFYFSLPKTD